MDAPERFFELEPHGGVTIVRFLDNQISPSAKEPLYALVEDEGHLNLLLDFEGIDTLSTYSLGVLANLQRKVDTLGGQLKFCTLSPDVKQLFRTTRFDQIFETYSHRDDALRAF